MDLARLDRDVKEKQLQLEKITSDIKMLSATKKDISEGIDKYRRYLDKLKKDYTELSNKNIALSSEVRNKNLSKSKIDNELSKRVDIVESLERDFEVKDKKFAEREKRFNEKESLFKAERVKFSGKEIELNKRKTELDKRDDVLTQRETDVAYKIKEADEKFLEAANRLNESQVNFDKIKEMSNALRLEGKKIQHGEGEIEEGIKVLNCKRQEVEQVKKEYSDKIIELNKLKEVVAGKDLSLTRALNDLENRENEVKIKEARIRKIVRDKNLKSELDNLEKSLK